MISSLRLATIDEILDAAADEYGSRVAVVDGNTELTFAEVGELSKRLAKQFIHLGIRKGDKVGIQLPNNWHYVVSHFALARIGAVLTPLNMAYRQRELRYMLQHNEVKMMIVPGTWRGHDQVSLIREIWPEVPSLTHIVVSGESTGRDLVSLSNLLNAEPDVKDAELIANRPELDDPFAIMFTSGTENAPKATLHTYRTFVPGHVDLAQEYQYTEQDVILCLGSFSHMFALPMMFLGVRNGLRHVMLESYSPDAFLELAARESVSVSTGVPSQWLDILRRSDEIGDHPALRLVVTGGSKIPPHMVHELRDKFCCTVAAQWGMTEVGAGTYTRPDDPPEKSWETIGRACPGGEARVYDEQLNRLPPGEIGELGYRSPSRFIEYYKNPAANESAFTDDGFFLTGDLVWMDDEGYLHFAGRTRDTINRGGLKIHAAEIEDLLIEHPAVRQVSLVKMPDPRLGERACAFVSLIEEKTVTLEELVTYLIAKGVAKYKLPERLEVRTELPTTATGKVRKTVLVSEILNILN